MSKKKDYCEICGNELILAVSTNEYKTLNCYYCKNETNTNIYCPKNHYICDECHSKNAIEIIREYCLNTELKDPFIMVEQIMNHPSFKMYGPEHHVLVPAVVLTCLKNHKYKNEQGKIMSSNEIQEAINRASKIPGGWCGFYGSCGAGIGTGVAISIFTQATPSKDKPRSLAITATSRVLSKIADNLEHCCKRSVKLAIEVNLEFLKEIYGFQFGYKPLKCSFSSLNNKCEKEKCPFY
ncbi:MAG: radical SAM protein [archaeon]|nr:radical SAM protein [archaeon]